MTTMKNKMQKILKVVKGDCIILSVEKDTLKVYAENKSPEDLKHIAGTFFKSVWKLTS